MESLQEKGKDSILDKEGRHFNASATHSCGGGDLLRYNLQRIDHRDVAQPPGNS